MSFSLVLRLATGSTRHKLANKTGHFRKPRSPPNWISRRMYTARSFDYEAKYFMDTKMRLQIDPSSGNRSIFARENIPAHQVILVTPYYNQIVHHDKQSSFCNACHDSLRISGTSLPSKFVSSHHYCSEACRDRGEPIDQEMESALRTIREADADFFADHRYDPQSRDTFRWPTLPLQFFYALSPPAHKLLLTL